MEPITVLKEEHEAIKVMLKILERMSGYLVSGRSVGSKDLEDAVEFIQGFADSCHHMKEEGVLFPAMEESGVPVRGGPIGVMLQEHELGRGYVRAMKGAIEEIDNPGARERFVENSRRYIELLESHIEKEDGILYPIAERHITKRGMERVLEEFERVEREETGEGVHEKYRELLHGLEHKYL